MIRATAPGQWPTSLWAHYGRADFRAMARLSKDDDSVSSATYGWRDAVTILEVSA
ncbi:MAG: hypothetical protein AAFX85_11020 [Pseudomonadota bacterium]